MLRLRRIFPSFVLTLLLVLTTLVSAQETLNNASVSGRVLDPSGAVVARSTVTATQMATNQTHTVQTDGQGRFRLPYLPVGEYQISAQADGFLKASRQVQLTVGSAFDITLQLRLATETKVEVTGEPPLIEENRSQVSQTVLQPEVANLPYEGRNYLDLSLLVARGLADEYCQHADAC